MLPKICARLKVIFVLCVMVFGFSEAVFSQEFVILRVFLNEEVIGDSVLVLMPDGDILIKREDLESTRLEQGLGKDVIRDGETYVSLKSIESIDIALDEKTAILKLRAAPRLFQGQTIGIAYKRPQKVIFPVDNSAFLNYGLLYDKDAEKFNLSTEAGVRIGDYLGFSSFSHTYGKEEDYEITRLMSFIRTDDRENMRTFIIGDFTGGGAPLGGSPLMGGISITKNYSVNPYFIRYPALTLEGSIETPSHIEVYINDILTRREKLSPGEFAFTDVPATIGLGDARIVIKDAYGRETEISRPFYYSERLLRKGLHEYNVGLGFLREFMGQEDFSYGDLAFIGLHNYGFSDTFKAGYSFEMTDNLVSAGPTASFVLPRIGGSIDAGVSASRSAGQIGRGGFMGYGFRGRVFNAGINMRGFSREFTNLSMGTGAVGPKFQLSSVAGVHLGRIGSASLEYSESIPHDGADTTGYGISYNKQLLRNVAFFAKGSSIHTQGEDPVNEVFLGMHITMDKNISASLNYDNRDGEEVWKAGVRKNIALARGFGFSADIEKREDMTNKFADLRYQGNYGIYDLDYRSAENNENYTVSAAGGLGYIDGSFFLSRPITDSFAKVQVGDLEGVRVNYYGNETSVTDRKGEAIVPVVQSFHDNRIEIAKDDVPIEYNIPSPAFYINPLYRSGSVVRFDVTKLQAFYGNIFIKDGEKLLPVEFSILKIFLKDKIVEGLIGKDGEFYFENVPPGAYQAKVFFKGEECVFNVTIPESDEVMVDIGELVCVMPSPDPSFGWVPRQSSPLRGEGVEDQSEVPEEIQGEWRVIEDEGEVAEYGVKMTVIVPVKVEPVLPPVPARAEELKGQTVQEAAEAAQSEALAQEKAARIAPIARGATPFLRVIHFRFASDTPVKWDAPVLKELSRLAKLNPNLKAVIRGYTDSLGSDEYNKALARRRVAFVKDYLMARGIKEEQIRETVGMGETHPVCDTLDRECRQANRRVEVLLLIK